jgi:hypothetical protein
MMLLGLSFNSLLIVVDGGPGIEKGDFLYVSEMPISG